jgi:hypothetical protein
LHHEAELDAAGKPLPPLTRSMIQHNYTDMIQEEVEKFRATGKVTLDKPVVDLYPDEHEMLYRQ